MLQNDRYLKAWLELPRQDFGKVPKWGHPFSFVRYSLNLLDELIGFLRGSYTEPVYASLELENKRGEKKKEKLHALARHPTQTDTRGSLAT